MRGLRSYANQRQTSIELLNCYNHTVAPDINANPPGKTSPIAGETTSDHTQKSHPVVGFSWSDDSGSHSTTKDNLHKRNYIKLIRAQLGGSRSPSR